MPSPLTSLHSQPVHRRPGVATSFTKSSCVFFSSSTPRTAAALTTQSRAVGHAPRSNETGMPRDAAAVLDVVLLRTPSSPSRTRRASPLARVGPEVAEVVAHDPLPRRLQVELHEVLFLRQLSFTARGSAAAARRGGGTGPAALRSPSSLTRRGPGAATMSAPDDDRVGVAPPARRRVGRRVVVVVGVGRHFEKPKYDVAVSPLLLVVGRRRSRVVCWLICMK